MRLVISILVFCPLIALAGEPIIDIHLHCYDETNYFVAPDARGKMAPPDHEAHFHETYRLMREHNIVLGIPSNNRSSEAAWMQKDSDGRFLRGAYLSLGREEWTPEEFEAEVKAGRVAVLGEIGAYYEGKTLADPGFEPFLEICERLGVPVAIHTGGGPSQITHRGAPKARLTNSNPLLIEEVLVRHPDLKLWLMHAGEFEWEGALRLMAMYPQVYADLGVLLWVHDMTKVWAERFLRDAQAMGMLDRVMFGSDQMIWPHGIEQSLQQLDSYEFLSAGEKRDILYNNAARFLGLSEETIEKHHQSR